MQIVKVQPQSTLMHFVLMTMTSMIYVMRDRWVGTTAQTVAPKVSSPWVRKHLIIRINPVFGNCQLSLMISITSSLMHFKKKFFQTLNGLICVRQMVSWFNSPRSWRGHFERPSIDYSSLLSPSVINQLNHSLILVNYGD